MNKWWPVLWCALIASIFSTLGMLNFGQAAPVLKEGESIDLLIGPEYSKKVLPLIKSAKKKVWVGVYVASYYEDRSFGIQNQFMKALVDAYKKGVDVKVVLDESLDWDSTKNGYSDKRSTKNDAVFNYLKKHGVPVLFDSTEQTMHGKFVIVDDQWVVLGSTNWTYSALSKNVEISTITNNEQINREMEDFFEILWKQSEKGQKVSF